MNLENTYDWETDEWSVPANLMVMQMIKLGSQLAQVGAGVRYWVDSPDGAADDYDLLSTVLHEIGHALGIRDPAVGSDDYFPHAPHVGGRSITIKGDHESHLANRAALMCKSCGASGMRRLPSAIDILAAAEDNGVTDIDLPRQDYLGWVGVATWNNYGNWMGNQVPEADDLPRELLLGEPLELFFEGLEDVRLETSLISPDGYAFESSYAGGRGLFGEIFSHGSRGSRSVIHRNGRRIQVPQPSAEAYGYGNVRFLGWAIPNEDGR